MRKAPDFFLHAPRKPHISLHNALYIHYENNTDLLTNGGQHVTFSWTRCQPSQVQQGVTSIGWCLVLTRSTVRLLDRNFLHSRKGVNATQTMRVPQSNRCRNPEPRQITFRVCGRHSSQAFLIEKHVLIIAPRSRVNRTLYTFRLLYWVRVHSK